MNLITALQVFVRVAETSSFSVVARENQMTQSAVSRQILHLEAHFGVRLLHRTTRKVSLTEDGRELLEGAQQLLDVVDRMETVLSGHRNSPTGLVRLGTSVAFGLYLAPRLSDLFARHPGLNVELVMRDQVGDMIEERLDLATCGGEITDSSLVSRPLGTFQRVVVAAPDYLARRGWPSEPNDLRRHDCIVHLHAHGGTEWRFAGPEGGIRLRVGGPLAVNNSEAAHLAVLAGQGVAMLPDIQVIDDIREGRLRQVLAAYTTEHQTGYVVYPSRRNLAPRTRAVIDFLVEQARVLEAERLKAGTRATRLLGNGPPLRPEPPPAFITSATA